MREEFKRCDELLSKRLPYEYNNLSGTNLDKRLYSKMKAVYLMIQRLEAPVAEELVQAAEDIIRDMYNVPDYVDLSSSIKSKDDIDLDTEQDDNPEAFIKSDVETSIQIREEIKKRILLNGFVHGSSMHIWKGAHYIISERLKGINPSLVELYDEYVAIISFMLWRASPLLAGNAIENEMEDTAGDGDGFFTQGFNQIEFEAPGEYGAKITSTGVNFPVLLHEINKGVIDYLVCKSIPDNFTEEELQYYYAKADDYKNEIWHYYLSPAMWAGLLEAASVSSQELPRIITRLADMNYQELSTLCEALMNDKELVTELLK